MNDWETGNNPPPIKDGLIAIGLIGGMMLFGHILSKDEGPPRRSSSKASSRKKGLSAQNLSNEIKKISSRNSAEKPNYSKLPQIESSSAEPSPKEGKWPLEYYTLSKGQQYKYRQRMKKDLTALR